MEISNQWYDDSDEGSENAFQKAILELSGKIIKYHMSHMGNRKIGKTQKKWMIIAHSGNVLVVDEMKNKQCGARLTVAGVVILLIHIETKGILKPLR